MDLKKFKRLNPPPFDAEKYVKRDVAVSFWKDSNDLLWRGNIYIKNLEYNNLSTKAKWYVDMIMAIECSLKSLIASLSQKSESPEQAYLAARKCSHNLDKLLQEVKLRAKNRVALLPLLDEKILSKANTLGVGFRYDITGFMFLSQEDWADRTAKKGLVSSILNHAFLDELNRVAHDLNSLSSRVLDKYLGHYAVLNMARWDEIHLRKTNFLKNLGGRL